MDDDYVLETPLVNDEEMNVLNRKMIMREIKKQLKLAGPLMAVNFMLFSLQVVSVMFVGHLGQLPLSGASVATSFASVTGLSLLVCSINSFRNRLDQKLKPMVEAPQYVIFSYMTVRRADASLALLLLDAEYSTLNEEWLGFKLVTYSHANF